MFGCQHEEGEKRVERGRRRDSRMESAQTEKEQGPGEKVDR